MLAEGDSGDLPPPVEPAPARGERAVTDCQDESASTDNIRCRYRF